MDTNKGGIRTGLAGIYSPSGEMHRDTCYHFVMCHGINLGDVPVEMRDYDMCLAAVKGNADAIRYVPEELIDRDICLAAVNADFGSVSGALPWVPWELRDREICLAAVRDAHRKTYPEKILDEVPDEFKAEAREIILEGLAQQEENLKYEDKLEDKLKYLSVTKSALLNR